MSKLKDKVRDWYKERMDASNREQDDEVADLDEYLIDELYRWARDEYNRSTAP